jgi:hypothetical protein
MILQGDTLKQTIEAAANASSFTINPLFIEVINLGGVTLSSRLEPLEQVLNNKEIRYVLQSLLRFSFLVEAVLTRGGATKMRVRWANELQNDPRYATFSECCSIFQTIFDELEQGAISGVGIQQIAGFATHKLVAYEAPLDYKQRLINAPIHQVVNIIWDWSDLPARVIQLRQFLKDARLHPYAPVFREVYRKIAVKTYLTDRAQTGEYQTNREKRWEAHPNSFQYALRRDCWRVEIALINQVCRFADFPEELRQQMEQLDILSSAETSIYRCPITQDILSFQQFQEEVFNPQHGKANFQVGHLNPLRAIGSHPATGHTATNIGWISADGNRIQGHLTLAETRTLLSRITRNYQEVGLI